MSVIAYAFLRFMKPYPLQLEISGPIALWARPDTLPNPVSYVAPTFSAVKGIFEYRP
jgi:CRISPR-associated protein Cas5d